MSATIPRFLLPRGYLLSSSQLPRLVKQPQIPYRTLPICRNASASTSKPRVLEKPTRFNPPSHGKRLKQQIPRQYGPQLTGEQKTEQRTKNYPNMMPAEGTFMHWFLTSRRIHIFISLGVLVFLASITAFENWRLATTFREQLPAAADFLYQPLTAISQAFEVYQLDVAKKSAEAGMKRKRDMDDVQKRITYRRAHGLEDEDSQGLGGWLPTSGEQSSGSGANAHGAFGRPVGVEPGQEVEAEGVMENGDTRVRPYNDWEGRKKPVKKWLGIW